MSSRFKVQSSKFKVQSGQLVGIVARPHPDLLPLGEGKAGVAQGVPVGVVGEAVTPSQGRSNLSAAIMIKSRIRIRSRSSSAKLGLVSTRSDRVKVSQTNGLGVVARPHPDLLPLGEGKAGVALGVPVGVVGEAVKPSQGRSNLSAAIMIKSRIRIRSRSSSAKLGLVSTRSDRVKVSQTNGLGVVARPHPDLLPLGEGKAGVAQGVPVGLVGEAVKPSQGRSNLSAAIMTKSRIRIKIRSRSSSAKPGLVSTRSDRVKVSQTNGLGGCGSPSS